VKISAVCRKFFSEVKNTLGFLRLKGELEESPAGIFLTGGGALYRPLAGEMETFFSLPVEMIDSSAAEDISIKEGVANNLKPMLMNQALALAIRETKKGAGFNLRGENSDRKEYMRNSGKISGGWRRLPS